MHARLASYQEAPHQTLSLASTIEHPATQVCVNLRASEGMKDHYEHCRQSGQCGQCGQ